MEEQQSGFVDPQLALAALTGAIKLGSSAALQDITQYDQNNPDPKYALERTSGNVGAGGKGNMNKLTAALRDLAPEGVMTADPKTSRTKVHLLQKGDKNYPGMTLNRNNPKTGLREWNVGAAKGADYGIYAHELGHVLAQSGKFGASVNDLRHAIDRSPKLQEMLNMAMDRMPDNVSNQLRPYMDARKIAAGGRLLLPAAIAAAIPGDDDVALTLAANLALSSPKLLDEALATNRGLAIMEKAGMPATPRQRMRLAGAWGSYLAQPLIASLIGNVAGNAVDADA